MSDSNIVLETRDLCYHDFSCQERLELQFGVYNGDVVDNKPHGQGSVQFYPDDLGGRKVFDGNWVNGRREGPGKMTWTTGEIYEGGWKNNLQQGRGEHSFASGHYDVAEWDQVLCR